MNPIRPLLVHGAFLSWTTLLLCLSGCNSGSSTGPTGQPSYTLSATSLNPESVTAGNTSTSIITVTPANGYTGSVNLSCSLTERWIFAFVCNSLSPRTPLIYAGNTRTEYDAG